MSRILSNVAPGKTCAAASKPYQIDLRFPWRYGSTVSIDEPTALSQFICRVAQTFLSVPAQAGMPVPPVFLVVTKHYAFPEVFQHLHQDMKQVERFLEAGKVGDPTQNIEIDIIDTLKEMVNSLKK